MGIDKPVFRVTHCRSVIDIDCDVSFLVWYILPAVLKLIFLLEAINSTVNASGGVSTCLMICKIFFVLSGVPLIKSTLSFSLIKTDLSINDLRTDMISSPVMYCRFIVVSCFCFTAVSSAFARVLIRKILNANNKI